MTPQQTSGLSLSTYFPEGTQFFYGYPAGEDSGFLNRVPPAVEELVAARPLCCAGDNVQVIDFMATGAPTIDQWLLNRLHLPQLSSDRVVSLPSEIDISIEGNARNDAVKTALSSLAQPGKLVMAQPYTDPTIAGLFQIDPSITSWLNDKSHMVEYFDSAVIPHRFATYASGQEFAAADVTYDLPVVVKASASSSGDGVYICRTLEDVTKAITDLCKLEATIFVEQYIEIVHNYGLHFGISHDATKPIDIIGINEQLTSPTGEFLGGIIDATEPSEQLQQSITYLQQTVLPKIRAMGWYGIGCFDVLADTEGNHYFIDCNFRMTGMSAYHFLIANDLIQRPMISFGAAFVGSEEELQAVLLPHLSEAGSAGLHLIALSRHQNDWNFNTALSYRTQAELLQVAHSLLSAGVQSQALLQIVATAA